MTRMIIIDTCVSGQFADKENPDTKPVRKWIKEERGKVAMGGTKMLNELFKGPSANKTFSKLLEEWKRQGRVFDCAKDKVDNRANIIENEGLCKSNDWHIIALAQISGARILYTAENKRGGLDQDFTNRELINDPPGNVYKNASHAHLLF